MEDKVPVFLKEEIIDGYSQERKVTLRVNTLKSHTEEIENELQNADIEYEKVPWSKEAFVIKNVREKEIQKLDIYKDGKIYLQSLSSMLPPIMLKPIFWIWLQHQEGKPLKWQLWLIMKQG